MWEWVAVAALAAVIYAATNVDDLLLLIGFFSDPMQEHAKILQGQVLGIALLYAMSILAARAAVLLPARYIGLLGIAPIVLGIVRLRDQWTGFAVHSAGQIAAMGFVFLVMTALWCVAARWLVGHPRLGAVFRRFGCRLLPYMLLALGIAVLARGNAATLIP